MDLRGAKGNKVRVGACLSVRAHAHSLVRGRCGAANFTLRTARRTQFEPPDRSPPLRSREDNKLASGPYLCW